MTRSLREHDVDAVRLDAAPRRPVLGAVVAPLAAVLLSAALPGAATAVELGGYIGYHQPLEQDDATDDVTVGARVRVPVHPLAEIEAEFLYVNMDRGPYRVRGVAQEVQEWSITAPRVAVVVGGEVGHRRAYAPYASLGAGLYFLRKDESPDADRIGLDLGLGGVVEMRPGLHLDVQARATRISLEQGGSRASISVLAGLSFDLGYR